MSRPTRGELASWLLVIGPPPFAPELRHTFDTANVVSGRPEFIEWRQRVAVTLNETLHCSVDPSFMMQEYFKWLHEHWKENRCS